MQCSYFCSVGYGRCVPNHAFTCPGLIWRCAVPNAPPLVRTSNMFSLLRMKHSCLVLHPSQWNPLPAASLSALPSLLPFFSFLPEVNPFQQPRFRPLSLCNASSTSSRLRQEYGCVPRDENLIIFCSGVPSRGLFQFVWAATSFFVSIVDLKNTNKMFRSRLLW